MEKSLPIWGIAPALLDSLRARNRLVLVAPTGSGKSTQVPQMLLDEFGGSIRKIVVLQPRRVAARSLAARVAWERGAKLGGEVGYQIRFEDETTRGTRIVFVTEGILLRWLQDDPLLRDIGAILFDEFHERSLMSDLALGLVKRLQETRRPELKMVVMSATLEVEALARYLGDAPVLRSEGRMFPVEVSYADYAREPRAAPELAAEAVEQLIQTGETGDILVFMPGMGEINATLNACRHLRASERLALIPLHGDLPPEEQDRAFEQNPLRKVIAATNVAETSVTIDGVRHVIDSGLARVARYDAERGIGTLHIEEISRASAEQRKGRAGRTAPGTCRRLWTESNHLNRPERHTPEIHRSDLAEIVLLLHSLGVAKAVEFDWLDRPEPAAVERAEALLFLLGALDEAGVTPIGRDMLRLPMHPRYSRMLIEARRHGCVPEAALCAALVSGRDLLVRLGRDDKHVAQAREDFENSDQSDFFVLMQAFTFARENRFDLDACRRRGIHAVTARQVEQTWRQIVDVARDRKLFDEKAARQPTEEGMQRAILAGFVDQLCVRKDQGTLDCRLTEGRTATLARESVVGKAPLFVAASIREITGKGGTLTLLGLATAVRVEWLPEMFPQHLSSAAEHVYDRTHKRVAAIRTLRFKDLALAQEHQKELDPALSGLALAEAYQAGLFELPNFTHELKQFIARVQLLVRASPELEFPSFDAAALKACLGRAFSGLSLAKEAQAANLRTAILSHLEPEQRTWLDELVPLAIPWHDDRKVKLHYSEQTGDRVVPPEFQAKLHECFAIRHHPSIAEGKVPVRLWLCAPDGKRLAPTENWPEFRAKEYPKLKPALQKKYPGFTWL